MDLSSPGDATRITPTALVFTRDRRNVLRNIYAAGTLAGLNPDGMPKVSCHDLRHSCAGLLFAAGVPTRRIASVLRHATTAVTMTVYGGLVESDRAGLRNDLEAALG